MERLRILVTDAHELAGLGVIRSLGRAGYAVVGAWPDTIKRPASHWSRYCEGTIRCPDPWRRQNEFREWMDDLMAARAFDAMVPISEASIVALDALRERAPDVGLIMPSRESLPYVLSKSRATAQALRIGIDCPETVFINREEPLEEQIDGLSAIGYPLVIKTDNYFADGGGYQKGRMYVARDRTDARNVLDYLWPGDTNIIVQRRIMGRGVGAFYLRHKGEVHLRFAHRRLHEVPWTGGWSSLRESYADKRLLDHGEKLLAAVDHEGVGMVEFIHSAKDDKYYFLEINGRFWGSLALALHCGVDFPRALMECYRTGRVASVNNTPGYPVGRRCRNVFPGELSYLASVFKTSKAEGGSATPSRARVIGEQVLLVLNPAVRHDHFWLKDPGPGLIQAGRALGHIGTKLVNAGIGSVAGRRKRSRLEKKLREHRWRSGRGACFDSLPRKILFVCHGNICRSPFAERYWNHLASERKHAALPECSSAGLHCWKGRNVPAGMVGLAARYKVDLTTHESRPLETRDVRDADAIFVMDAMNYEDLLARFPEAESKTYFLGMFEDGGRVEIEDPYSLDPQGAARSYEHVARAVAALIEVIVKESGAIVN